MGATLRICEDLYDEEFSLVGIHTSLEDYALVYALNEVLKIRLKRSIEDLSFSSSISYPCFEWKDELYDRNWALFTNSCITAEQSKPNDLFPEEPSYTSHHLVPEYKEVTYFLKMDDYELNSVLLKKIKDIPKIVTAYTIETEKLKSKPNLIF
ncbi:MAG: IPExxxVDY family protein [Eudoraea sp.]|nr:IPExxxVDY family protein [Eudoraea sp.]